MPVKVDGQKRLMAEYKKYLQDPPDNIMIMPDPDDHLKWWFLVLYLPDSPYSKGVYLGRIDIPKNYPFDNPGMTMFTPSGRFDPGQRICTTQTSFYRNRPSVAISLCQIIMAFISIWQDDSDSSGTSFLVRSQAERERLARESMNFNLTDKGISKTFTRLFPEITRNMKENLDFLATRKASVAKPVKRTSQEAAPSTDSAPAAPAAAETSKKPKTDPNFGSAPSSASSPPPPPLLLPLPTFIFPEDKTKPAVFESIVRAGDGGDEDEDEDEDDDVIIAIAEQAEADEAAARAAQVAEDAAYAAGHHFSSDGERDDIVAADEAFARQLQAELDSEAGAGTGGARAPMRMHAGAGIVGQRAYHGEPYHSDDDDDDDYDSASGSELGYGRGRGRDPWSEDGSIIDDSDSDSDVYSGSEETSATATAAKVAPPAAPIVGKLYEELNRIAGPQAARITQALAEMQVRNAGAEGYTPWTLEYLDACASHDIEPIEVEEEEHAIDAEADADDLIMLDPTSSAYAAGSSTDVVRNDKTKTLVRAAGQPGPAKFVPCYHRFARQLAAMTPDELVRHFGESYPVGVTFGLDALPLTRAIRTCLTRMTDSVAEAVTRRMRQLSEFNEPVACSTHPIEERVRLYPFQRDGVAWMYWREMQPSMAGGILADEMGLGKTVQSVALMRAHPVPRTLVVCPPAVLGQWITEAKRVGLNLVQWTSAMWRRKTARERELPRLFLWVITRDTLRSFVATRPRLDRLVLDEAHQLGGKETMNYIRELRAKHVWCLTGTPLPKGLISEWDLYINLTYPREIMETLRTGTVEGRGAGTPGMRLLQNMMIRRRKDTRDAEDTPIFPDIPVRHVLFAAVMDKEEKEWYAKAHENAMRQYRAAAQLGNIKRRTNQLARQSEVLRRLCNGPNFSKIVVEEDVAETTAAALRRNQMPAQTRDETRTNRANLIAAKLMDDNTHEYNLECSICYSMFVDPVALPCNHVLCVLCCGAHADANRAVAAFNPLACPLCRRAFRIGDVYMLHRIAPLERFGFEPQDAVAETERVVLTNTLGPNFVSAKMRAVLDALEEVPRDKKVVIASHWNDVIEAIGRLIPGSVRIDGTQTPKKRNEALEAFHDHARVMLISMRAGGVGINLTDASHLFIVDPWVCKPANDQLISRLVRIGQKEPEVVVTRFFTDGCADERIVMDPGVDTPHVPVDVYTRLFL